MKWITTLTAAVALGSAMPSFADISYAQRVSIEAAGGMSLFASDAEILTQIAEDRSRTESRVQMKSRLARMFAGSGDTATIVRLDKQLIWDLDLDKKQYTQMSFAQAREQLEAAMKSMQDAQSSGGGSLPVSEEDCSWSEADLSVEHPRGTEKVADIKTKKHIVRMQQSCTDRDTGKTCDMTWMLEAWMAKKVPGEKEVQRFHQQYAQAMGLGDLEQQMHGPARSLLSMFGGNWGEVMEEFKEIRGYPMRTAMQMEIGGEQCTTASGQPIGLDDVWADASTAGYNAALDQAGAEAGSAVADAAGTSLGDSIGGAIGGAAVGAAASELIGGFTGMFRKSKPSEKPAEAQANTAGAPVTLFRITSEVTSWGEVTVPQDRFAEPAGWKKR
tara:strand:- start:311041 stop:312201 length:1161 start_codon:yes stop_codon:yes gene_type:complete